MVFSILPKTFFYNFISKCKYAYIISSILFVISILVLFLRGGIPLGVDFQGGSLVQIRSNSAMSAEAIRNILEKTELQDIVIQSLGGEGHEYSIRFSSLPEGRVSSEVVLEALKKAFPEHNIEIERAETVGSKVSTDMRDKALEALYYALLIIAIYISGRFEERWGTPLFITGVLAGVFFIFSRFTIPILYVVPIVLLITIVLFIRFKLAFALGAILSLLHDVLLTSGLLIVFGVSFDLSIVAALLAILGYSLNDTIIVYDRIREYVNKGEKEGIDSLENNINKSISSTLSRTLLTSITTLLVLFSLLLFGGALLFPFALAITIGVLIGTFSSVFIASPILLLIGIQERVDEPIIIDENGVL